MIAHQKNIVFLYFVLLGVIMSISSPGFSKAKVTTWPLPAGFSTSPQFTVTIDGHECPVIQADLFTKTHFAYFDFSGGKVTVKVTATDTNYFAHGARIKPTAKKIKATVSGNTATFTLSTPAKISIENPDVDFRADHTKSDVLVLLACAPDKNPPSATDPNVIYRGPGLYTEDIDVPTGKTLYLDGGAIVMGTLNVFNADNAKIRGRGVVIFDDPNRYDKDHGTETTRGSHPLIAVNATHLSVEGVKLIPRCHTWTASFRGGSDITIENIAIFNDNRWHFNGDGIDLTNTSNVIIRDCFIRSDDDAVAMYPSGSRNRSSTEWSMMTNILVENCVIWPAVSNVVRCGWDTADRVGVDGFTIRNCDIIHGSNNLWGEYQHGLFQSLDFSGRSGAQIYKNFIAEDIRMENYQCLMSFSVSTVTLSNWHFKNITCDDAGLRPSVIKNIHIDPEKGIFFDNYRVNGKVVTNITDIPLKFTGEGSSAIHFQKNEKK